MLHKADTHGICLNHFICCFIVFVFVFVFFFFAWPIRFIVIMNDDDDDGWERHWSRCVCVCGCVACCGQILFSLGKKWSFTWTLLFHSRTTTTTTAHSIRFTDWLRTIWLCERTCVKRVVFLSFRRFSIYVRLFVPFHRTIHCLLWTVKQYSTVQAARSTLAVQSVWHN